MSQIFAVEFELAKYWEKFQKQMRSWGSERRILRIVWWDQIRLQIACEINHYVCNSVEYSPLYSTLLLYYYYTIAIWSIPWLGWHPCRYLIPRYAKNYTTFTTYKPPECLTVSIEIKLQNKKYFLIPKIQKANCSQILQSVENREKERLFCSFLSKN